MRQADDDSMLTSTERLHYDALGYVLLRNVLSAEECRDLLELARRMQAGSAYPRQERARQTILYGAAWFDGALLSLAMSPRLRGRAEELIGGEARLEESEFIVLHPPGKPHGAGCGLPEAASWHRGLTPGPGSFERDGRYHCLLVKTILYLTDNGPDAGTWVIPGSHRLPADTAQIAAAADPDLARHLPARQGDVLLFGETLVHASPSPAIDSDRVILVIGYSPPHLRPWSAEHDPPETLATALSPEERRFVYGEARYRGRSDS